MKAYPILVKEMPWNYLRKQSQEGKIIHTHQLPNIINFFLSETIVLSPEKIDTLSTQQGNCCSIKENCLHLC